MKVAFDDEFNGPLSIARDGPRPTGLTGAGVTGAVRPLPTMRARIIPSARLKEKRRNTCVSTPPKGRQQRRNGHADDGRSPQQLPRHHGACALLPGMPFPGPERQRRVPAFWTVTVSKDKKLGADELDVIEAYGTNSKTGGIWTPYHCTTHFWGQPKPEWDVNHEKGPDGNPYEAHRLVQPTEIGGKTSWSTTFHTYGLLVTKEYTAYFLDDIEVLSHPSGRLRQHCPSPLW